MADSFYEQALKNGRQSAPRKKASRTRPRNKQDIPPIETEELLDMVRGLVDVVRRRVREQATHCPNCTRPGTDG